MRGKCQGMRAKGEQDEDHEGERDGVIEQIGPGQSLRVCHSVNRYRTHVTGQKEEKAILLF